MHLFLNKKIILVFLLITLSFSLFAQNFAGKRIAVTEPKFINGTEDTAWIPLMVQGLLTTNLQNYSKMQVIDRTNLDKVKAEQKSSESAFNDDSYAIELGKLATAQYIVAATIIKTSTTYSFDCKITDTETSNSVGKSFTKSGCTLAEIENGNVINQASRELLLGLGVPESELKELVVESASNTKQNSAVKSNVALAKGMAQETVNQNVVQALSYYKQALNADSSMAEATARLNSLTSAVTTGNIREDAKNEIALRKAWLKTLDDLREYYVNNILYFVYDTNLQNEVDVVKETVTLLLPYYVEINQEALDITKQIISGFRAVAKNSWMIDVYSYLNCDFFITASIYDENQNCLCSWENRNTRSYHIAYREGRNEPYFDTTEDLCFLQFEPLSYEKITDTLSIKIDSIKVNKFMEKNNKEELKAPLIIVKDKYESQKAEAERLARIQEAEAEKQKDFDYWYNQKAGSGAKTGLGAGFGATFDGKKSFLSGNFMFTIGIMPWLYTGLNVSLSESVFSVGPLLGVNYRIPFFNTYPNLYADVGIGFGSDSTDAVIDESEFYNVFTTLDIAVGVDYPLILGIFDLTVRYRLSTPLSSTTKFSDSISVGIQYDFPFLSIYNLFK